METVSLSANLWAMSVRSQLILFLKNYFFNLKKEKRKIKQILVLLPFFFVNFFFQGKTRKRQKNELKLKTI